MALQSVFLNTLTLLRAAGSEHPFRTRCGTKHKPKSVKEGRTPSRFESRLTAIAWSDGAAQILTQVAEAAVQSRVTQTRSICAMAPSVMGAVTFLIALLSIETFRTSWGGEYYTNIPFKHTSHNIFESTFKLMFFIFIKVFFFFKKKTYEKSFSFLKCLVR